MPFRTNTPALQASNSRIEGQTLPLNWVGSEATRFTQEIQLSPFFADFERIKHVSSGMTAAKQ
jgi:hypothetical protein